MKKHFKVKNTREEGGGVLFENNPERKTASVKKVAIVVFFDDKGNIIVQKRDKSSSKVGEKYGFFGGQIEKRETPKRAIERELKEELGFIPKRLDYWGEYDFIIKETVNPEYADWLIKCHVFLSPATSALGKAVIKEGIGMTKMPIDKVIKGKGFPSGSNSTKFLREVKQKLFSGNK